MRSRRIIRTEHTTGRECRDPMKMRKGSKRRDHHRARSLKAIFVACQIVRSNDLYDFGSKGGFLAEGIA